MQPIALVVDDEPMVRMTTADLVGDAGYWVLEAADAIEAMQYLEEFPALVLLITDIRMPEVDGLTFARHVAAHSPHISMIVTSGAVSPGIGELPADAKFLAKPFTPDAVFQLINDVRRLH